MAQNLIDLIDPNFSQHHDPKTLAQNVLRFFNYQKATGKNLDLESIAKSLSYEVNRLAASEDPNRDAAMVGLYAARGTMFGANGLHLPTQIFDLNIDHAKRDLLRQQPPPGGEGPKDPPPAASAKAHHAAHPARGNFDPGKFTAPDENITVSADDKKLQEALNARPIATASQFAVNDTTLTAEAKAELDKFAQNHKAGEKIVLVGHTSATGSAKHNEKLSLARAGATMAYLLSKGVAAADMRVAGVGATHPANKNGPRENADNRRVTIIPDPGVIIPTAGPQTVVTDQGVAAQPTTAPAPLNNYMKDSEIRQLDVTARAALQMADRHGLDHSQLQLNIYVKDKNPEQRAKIEQAARRHLSETMGSGVIVAVVGTAPRFDDPGVKTIRHGGFGGKDDNGKPLPGDGDGVPVEKGRIVMSVSMMKADQARTAAADGILTPSTTKLASNAGTPQLATSPRSQNSDAVLGPWAKAKPGHP